MDIEHLRCFVAAAEALHFAQAARGLEIEASALGRNIRHLEATLGTPLFARTTRNVALTAEGAALLPEARALIAQADDMLRRFRQRSRAKATSVRMGVIDTAAAGLVPLLLSDFRKSHPAIQVQLTEDKSIRLLPRLLSGSLDLAIIRPPPQFSTQIEILPLFHETAVVAVPADHPLCGRARVVVADIAAEPLILPNRRSRPHSHDLTVKLFERVGLRPIVAQLAEEKQTIVGLVAAGIGIAIVPRWSSRMVVPGVVYIPLETGLAEADAMLPPTLPLAAAWMRGARDPARDALLAVLRGGLPRYAAEA